MIKFIIGGIGSGKTITAVKEMVHSDMPCFTNITIKHKNIIRLKVEHIVRKEVIGVTAKGKQIIDLKINWDFWNEQIKKYKKFNIVIDEAHNIINSRRSMSKWNILFSTWLTQIRKIIGDSEHNHLYMVSQRLNSLDLVGRDLVNEIIYCQKIPLAVYDGEIEQYIPITTDTEVYENSRKKIKELQIINIIKTVFCGEDCVEMFLYFKGGYKSYNYRTRFLANDYFKFYDTYQIVQFGEGVYL